MSSRTEILGKIKILITQNFSGPEEAMAFFDENGDGTLEYGEIKKLVKEAGINRFLSGVVADKIIEGLDKDDNETLNWHEFEKATDELLA